MYVLKDMPKQLDAGLLKRLATVETATIGHFYHGQFMDPALRAVIPDRRVAGTAVTVAIPGPDSTLLHHVLGLVRPGDFLVIDRLGDVRHACWGGVVTQAAKLAGVVGAAIDGPATDFPEIRQTDMPLWCRGPSPITTKQLALGGYLNTPVSCGGAVVEAGDAVLADESGIVILKPHQIEAAIEEGLRRQAREPETVAKLRAGTKLPEISGATAKIKAAMAKQT
ncbi:MAG: RraA family protein [Proteobacteria bacterium]|nr:RraA family protein [Pseudomonadota bacterium]